MHGEICTNAELVVKPMFLGGKDNDLRPNLPRAPRRMTLGLIEVPALRHRLRCIECGSRPNDIRPNWLEYRAPGMRR